MAGLEPATIRLTVEGSAIELLSIMVGRVGIEPTVFTLWVPDLQSGAFASYAYLPINIKIAEGGTRTHGVSMCWFTKPVPSPLGNLSILLLSRFELLLHPFHGCVLTPRR